MLNAGKNLCVNHLDTLNTLLELYLERLDSWQREVDNIRIMHHDVWKGSRLSPLIKQHRAGSRVEKQTRILPIGGQTDVDYMFEVTDVEVHCDANQDYMYFKSSSSCEDNGMSNAYGKVYLSEAYKSFIECHEMYGKIFAEAMLFDEEEKAFLLIPARFKENVVLNCGLDYKRNEVLSSTISPSISGQGALNEYDGVPCLKLSSWPETALNWVKRKTENGSIFSSEWTSEIVQNVPLFLVPTGNPMSQEQDIQFRLSFSMVEIACFKQLISPMRKMYGIVKYLFKALFAESSLLSSYHVKTMMLWKIDQTPVEKWGSMKPVEFAIDMMEEIRRALRATNIPHFFVQNCNIFPVHKVSDQNMHNCMSVFTKLPKRLEKILGQLLRQDLGISFSERWLAEAVVKLQQDHETDLNAYISGYLTRLLSVVTFSLTENYSKSSQLGDESWKEIQKIFVKYENDRHISRIIPMVNSTARRLQVRPKIIRSRVSLSCSSKNKDKLSRIIHEAFEAYTNGDYSSARDHLRKAIFFRKTSSDTAEGIGISVTKFHRCLQNDAPILNVIELLENENNGRCPRFYIAPNLLAEHMTIQLQISSLLINTPALQQAIDKLQSIVGRLSYKEPYLGKLSYRFAGVYLLRGYEKFIRDQQLPVLVVIPWDEFNQRRFATNFNLR
ncbi:cyclic GMP-AMP synthase-like receptor 2 [Montipora foliosa]|uniref:cyclic GMP-AMP synthase-like receptor 2 n=1 Tax=Montipora foliosa TaxID=591990 RepID=UPI0035F1FDAB